MNIYEKMIDEISSEAYTDINIGSEEDADEWIKYHDDSKKMEFDNLDKPYKIIPMDPIERKLKSIGKEFEYLVSDGYHEDHVIDILSQKYGEKLINQAIEADFI